MPPFFIVENERRVVRGAEIEAGPGNIRIPGERAPAGGRNGAERQARSRKPERLTRVREGFRTRASVRSSTMPMEALVYTSHRQRELPDIFAYAR